jgi:hypothetical protein
MKRRIFYGAAIALGPLANTEVLRPEDAQAQSVEPPVGI